MYTATTRDVFGPVTEMMDTFKDALRELRMKNLVENAPVPPTAA